MARTRKKKRQTVRIPYGPPGDEKQMYWTVDVQPAKQVVSFDGSVEAAMNAYPGVSVGCAISNAAKDNPKDFPHPLYLMDVRKNVAHAVYDLNKDGSPRKAYTYAHNLGKLVDMNDTGELKEAVKDEPAIIERLLHLRPPRKQQSRRAQPAKKDPPDSKRDGPEPGETSERQAAPPTRKYKGALRRAVKAGLIGKHMAGQLQHLVSVKKKSHA